MIVHIPFSDGTHPSCAEAPKEILNKLKEIWANENGEKFQIPQIQEATIENIPEAKIYLGGDHTITYYTAKKFFKKNPKAKFIVFDAHPDVFQAFGTPTHQDYLKFLIEEKLLNPKNILAIGIRAAHPDETQYYKEKNIQHHTCKDFSLEKAKTIFQAFLTEEYYLSIDLDVLDPSYAPGVSYIEPGGLTTRQLLNTIHILKEIKPPLAMDIVELNPGNDVKSLTAKTAARILAEFL